MVRITEKLKLIPGEQRVRFAYLHKAMGIALAQQPQRKLEPKFIEHNLEPLSEESSSTLCCMFATFGFVLSDRPTCHHLESWRYNSGHTRP